ncbi:hypothetical protein O3P69_018962 [Scylla paramamosain]|uniref:Urocanate hydratase n=2 Tax=Scylla paramamosain TaxID=85552 RepID=A0AAW0SJM0_SCYPA
MEASRSKITLKELCGGLPVSPLPPPRIRDPSIAHAPVRTHTLTPKQKELALSNALRYFPDRCHSILGPEFAEELRVLGHIYMYRFLPDIDMR